MAAQGAEAQLLLSVGLIERDSNGDTLWVWGYPSVTGELRELLLRKCTLREEKPPPRGLLYGRYKRTWFYLTCMRVSDQSPLDKVTHFCVVLTAKDFNPEKYAAFSRMLCRTYEKQGSPVPMLESYISVLTRGSCRSEDNGTFVCRDYEQRAAFLSGSIKDVISQFGMEAVILYTAVMLKKRIAVYHPRLEAAQEFTRALPAFAWHRQDWSIIHPYVHLNPEELEALKSCPGYIGGFHDHEISNRPDLYDVFVNLAEGSITVSPNAKEALTMGKLHKDIGQLIVSLADDPEVSDGQVIKDISGKTWEILSILRALADDAPEGEKPTVNMERLRQKRLPPATENFLFHLAAAEQMLQT